MPRVSGLSLAANGLFWGVITLLLVNSVCFGFALILKFYYINLFFKIGPASLSEQLRL